MFISESLREQAKSSEQIFAVFIEVNGDPPASIPGLRAALRSRIEQAGGSVVPDTANVDNPFLYAQVSGVALTDLIEHTAEGIIVEIDDDRLGFNKRNLTNSVILEPLLSKINEKPGEPYHVIIDVNLEARAGREDAFQQLSNYLDQVGVPESKRRRREGATHPYIFATMTGNQIKELAGRDQDRARNQRSASASPGAPGEPARTISPVAAPLAPFLVVYKIWEDSEIHALISRSVATVKADAAQIAFSARGGGVVWAVMDSGIEKDHVHFQLYKNLEPQPPVVHRDFTVGTAGNALSDGFGHGTHVAGILAGQSANAQIVSKVRNDDGSTGFVKSEIPLIFGMAPECKLVSMKVLDERGRGQVSWMIDAIDAIQKINDHGRRILIQGVNMSVGYEFDPEWFACGQSPLCVEVNRLVKSGVVVVVAAGNTGYGFVKSADRVESVAAGLPLTINDPGNADLAITVGATHRSMPHTYGVSYFSSKGPTGDGRCKPDLVAPGEKILSCAAGRTKSRLQAAAGVSTEFDYLEDSGTSMAAPHVSGVIAAFLSIRPEYRGEPEKVKSVFLGAATDLGRDRMFQGTGLVDLMRAIQSV